MSTVLVNGVIEDFGTLVLQTLNKVSLLFTDEDVEFVDIDHYSKAKSKLAECIGDVIREQERRTSISLEKLVYVYFYQLALMRCNSVAVAQQISTDVRECGALFYLRKHIPKHFVTFYETATFYSNMLLKRKENMMTSLLSIQSYLTVQLPVKS